MSERSKITENLWFLKCLRLLSQVFEKCIEMKLRVKALPVA